MPEKIMQTLRDISRKLQEPCQCGGGLLDLISPRIDHIPLDLCNALKAADWFNDVGELAFLGYELISEEELIYHLKERKDNLSFFGAYDYSSDFILTDEMEIYIESDLNEELKYEKK